MLLETGEPMAERLDLVRKLAALIDPERAKKYNLPYLDLTKPAQVLIWSKIRLMILGFKGVTLARCEVIISILLTAVLAACGLLLFFFFKGLHSEVNRGSFILIGIFALLVAGTYLVKPILSNGLLTNGELNNMIERTSYEKWRVIEFHGTDPKNENTRLAAELMRGLFRLEKEIDVSFKLFGIAVSQSMLISIAGSAIVSGASAIWSLATGQGKG